MSVRDASVAGLRAAAREVRTSAARVGLAGWHVAADGTDVAPHWEGAHATAWARRNALVAAAARQLEQGLRAVATHVELYACAVEAAQRRLDALDAEADRVRADAAARRRAWEGEPPQARGPMPSSAAGLASVQAARAAVEEEALEAARAFGTRVRATVGGAAVAPRLTPLGDLLEGLETLHGWGVKLPADLATLSQAVRRLLGRPGSVLPPQLRVPLRAAGEVLAPLGAALDATTLVTGSGEKGLRGVTDRVFAGLGVVTFVGGLVVVGGTAPVWLPAVVVGGAVVGAVYGVGTVVWDAVPRPQRPSRPVPARPRPAGPRVPQPRLPLAPPSGQWPDTRPASPFPGVTPPTPPVLGPPVPLGPRVPVQPRPVAPPRGGAPLPATGGPAPAPTTPVRQRPVAAPAPVAPAPVVAARPVPVAEPVRPAAPAARPGRPLIAVLTPLCPVPGVIPPVSGAPGTTATLEPLVTSVWETVTLADLWPVPPVPPRPAESVAPVGLPWTAPVPPLDAPAGTR